MGGLFRRMPDPIVPPRAVPVHSVPTHSPAQTSAASTRPIGLNVHDLTPARIADCRRLGVRQVRTTVYADRWYSGDPAYRDAYRAGVWRVLDALAPDAGLDVLPVIHAGDPARWPEVAREVAWLHGVHAVQIGNENDQGAAAMAGDTYADVFRACRQTVPRGVALVAAAAGGDDPAFFVRALRGVWPVPYDAVAVHAYGLPPAAVLDERVRAVRAHTAAPIWLTEFGVGTAAMDAWQVPADQRGARQAAEWQAVATAAPGLVERAYGFVLHPGDPEGMHASDATQRWLTTNNGRVA
jgi:hypothetical protein